MGIHYSSGYTVPPGDWPLTHARIAHAGNWFGGVVVTASATADGFFTAGPAGLTTHEPWRPHGNRLTAARSFDDDAWTLTGATAMAAVLAEDDSTGGHAISADVEYTAEPHVASVDVLPEFRDEIRLVADDGATEFGCFFDLASGSVGTASAGCEGSIIQIDGFLRCEIRFTPIEAPGTVSVALSEGGESLSYEGQDGPGVILREVWVSPADATWEVDLRSAREADYCVIAGHNMATAGAVLALEYWDGAAWVERVAVEPSNDTTLWLMFPPTIAARWRLVLTGGRGLRLANVKIGRAMQMPVSTYQGNSPLGLSRQVVLRSVKSATGQFLQRTRQRVMLQTDLTWQHLPKSWVDANWPLFQRALEEAPFFLAWRPASHDEAAMCHTETMPVPQISGPKDYMSVTLAVTALSDD